MTKLTSSHSLTDFERNARCLMESLDETHEPVLLTVNGKVQAVLVDPDTYRDTEEQLQEARVLAAIREGERDILEGRTRPLDEVSAALRNHRSGS